MKKVLLVTALFTLAANVDANASNSNCELAQKELNLIKSQKEMIIAKYKLAIKENIRQQLKASEGQTGQTGNNAGGRKITLNVDANSQPVKAITKLSIAEATFEAMLEMCKDGSLKPEIVNATDGYKSQIIPKPEEMIPQPQPQSQQQLQAPANPQSILN